MKRPAFRLLPLTITAVAILCAVRINNLMHTNFRSLSFDAHGAEHGGDDKKQAAPLNPEIEKKVMEKQDKPVMQNPVGFDSAQVDVLQSLVKRRKELEELEQKIDTREAAVLIAEKKVDERLSELKKLSEALDKKLGTLTEKEAKQIDNLAKMYQSMGPEDAAKIFNKLEMDIILRVLGKMSPMKSSPILAKMDTEKAREITSALADGSPQEPKTAELKSAALKQAPTPAAKVPEPKAPPAPTEAPKTEDKK